MTDEIKKKIEEKYGFSNAGFISMQAAEWGYSLAANELEDAGKEIARLKEEIDGWIAYKQNIDQALNSGDGSYRP